MGSRLTLSMDLSFLRAFGLPAAPGPSQSSKLMLSTLRRSFIFCTYRGLAPPLLGFRLSLLVDLFFLRAIRPLAAPGTGQLSLLHLSK